MTNGMTPTTEPRSSTDVSTDAVLRSEDFSLWYGDFQAIDGITLDIPKNQVTAIIGPSGCGKSTYLRALNRMNDLIANVEVDGQVLYHGQNIYDRRVDPVQVRRHIGMVFQKPNPFPKSIYENIAFGLRINGFNDAMDDRVEKALKRAALWDEVKDDLHDKKGLDLSGGQQQRLCIARALAIEPDVLLMDEPASALDPVATAKIEDLIHELKQNYTVGIVTHNMQQAARVSDRTAFFYLGQLIEVGSTPKIFENPDNQQTEDYVTGKFG
ncbi:MAG: phosphate ABC transporter ATP-binding protein PstB [Candidatus Bipolaricaulia bacterium]